MTAFPIAVLLVSATLLSATERNLAGVTGLQLGHADFVPTPEQPVGFRGDGTGWFPGAKGVVTAFDGKSGSNILWVTKLPAAGQASPIVFGGKLFACADPDQLLCLDADTGKILWSVKAGLTAPAGKPGGYVNAHSWTMPSPVSDGKHVVAKFALGALLCADVDGKLLWKAEIPGSFHEDGILSPLLVDGLVVVHVSGLAEISRSPKESDRNDRYEAGELRAYDVATGTQRWTVKSLLNGGSSPAVAQVDGRKLIVTGRGGVYRPGDGQELLPPRPTKAVGKEIEKYLGHAGEHASVLASGDRVYLYRSGHTRNDAKLTLSRLNMKPDGNVGFTPQWEARYVHRVHGTSVEAADEVYAVGCYGDFVAMDGKTGKGRFTNILAGRDVLWHPFDIGLPLWDRKSGLRDQYGAAFKNEMWSGPVVADGHVFLFTQYGAMICVRPQPKPEVVGVGIFDADSGSTRLPSFCASPFFSGNRMYVRTPSAVVCVAPRAGQKETNR